MCVCKKSCVHRRCVCVYLQRQAAVAVRCLRRHRLTVYPHKTATTTVDIICVMNSDKVGRREAELAMTTKMLIRARCFKLTNQWKRRLRRRTSVGTTLGSRPTRILRGAFCAVCFATSLRLSANQKTTMQETGRRLTLTLTCSATSIHLIG